LFFLKGGTGAGWVVYFFSFNIFFGAFSRYPLQSFVPNTGTKGFPLLSGLGKLKPFLVAAILIKAFFFFEPFISLFLLGNINSITNERYVFQKIKLHFRQLIRS
jgi:hypothetical protein